MNISTPRQRTLLRIGTLAVGAALAFSTTALPASANDRDVIRRAACSSGELKLKLSPEDGRIETEVEVDTNRNGQKWTVRIYRNGNRVVTTSGVTKGRSGSFEVRRLLANGAGPDKVRATATRNGRTCAVSATL